MEKARHSFRDAALPPDRNGQRTEAMLATKEKVRDEQESALDSLKGSASAATGGFLAASIAGATALPATGAAAAAAAIYLIGKRVLFSYDRK